MVYPNLRSGTAATSPHPRIRALVAEGDPVARKRLVDLLGGEPDVDVVGECGNGLAAVEAVRRLEPDVAFLEVQLRGLDAFGVIDAIDAGRRPLAVLVAVHEAQALRAFDIQALDCVLKPFESQRLRQTVQRIRARLGDLRRGNGDHGPGPVDRDDRRGGPASAFPRLVVRSGRRVVFLRPSDIDWVEAAGNYVKLHVGAEAHLLRGTMSAFESKLDPAVFSRVHRSHIVNLERVRELRLSTHGDYAVVLRDGTTLTLSRGCREGLRERLGSL